MEMAMTDPYIYSHVRAQIKVITGAGHLFFIFFFIVGRGKGEGVPNKPLGESKVGLMSWICAHKR